MLKTVVVCDTCEEPGEPVRVKVNGRTYEKDLCSEHLKEEFETWRPAKRGRPRRVESA